MDIWNVYDVKMKENRTSMKSDDMVKTSKFTLL